MNKPTETCRQTSDLPGSHPIIYQKASFSDCLGVKHGVDPRQFHPNRGCVVISTPWRRSRMKICTNRIVWNVSLRVFVGHLLTLIKTIPSWKKSVTWLKFSTKGLLYRKEASHNSMVTLKSTTRFMRRSEESGMKQIHNPSAQLKSRWSRCVLAKPVKSTKTASTLLPKHVSVLSWKPTMPTFRKSRHVRRHQLMKLYLTLPHQRQPGTRIARFAWWSFLSAYMETTFIVHRYLLFIG